ncbi:hypothetical protein GGI25_001439 [Coemansia spiralis]|uniref:CRAL-TRIO domain-containing protein n=2 Tax=Coemansia TaxID=4863 RepID=A0A9W8G9W9_9FUNG|nr:hypothetical protein BX070DRAFT_70296 [Coemansia spiralis]KAJ1994781.1 hypothetical protein EDC05_001403 [Coemansia umbellata]KAJ2624518.1 hypothetical protein GGI26_001437 [Coemansia sp. RSA 1358]KAJ2679516.1 hypothetical protein GGI25_001439 [Coemansia spiralis]
MFSEGLFAVAQEIASEVRARRDDRNTDTSTYVSSFLTEFLEDTANTLRVLRACAGDRAKAVDSLSRTLEWREASKIYPAKKHINIQSLVVDFHGFVVVSARKQALVLSSLTLGAMENNGVRRRQLVARAVETMEDARVALKSAYSDLHDAQAAIVVPVESFSLADVFLHDILLLVDIATTHYRSMIGRLYITAASSVLLEHARQALYPVLGRLNPECTKCVVFVLADKLDAETALYEKFSAQNIAKLAGTFSAARLLSDRGRHSGTSVCSTDVGTDEDFCSACSEAPSCLDGNEHKMALKRPASRLSCLSRDTNLAILYGDQSIAASHAFPSSLSIGASHQRHSRDKHQLSFSGQHIENTSNSSSTGQHTDSGSSVTPIQLASLQRAVQSVQKMLGSINENIIGADSRAALAATRSKLVQQADVLMSTVAALNFGVSMADDGTQMPSYFERRGSTSSSGSSNTVASQRVLSAGKVPSANTNFANMLQVLLPQLLALPLSVLLGKSGSKSLGSLRVLFRLVRRAIWRLRRMPTVHSLLLLAYKNFRIYAMVLWTGALLVWQANAAMIWSNLMAQWKRGVSF